MLGLCSVTLGKYSVEEVIEIIKPTKIQSIEWWGKDHVPPGDLENARRVGNLTREAGLVVSSYGSYFRLLDGLDAFKEVVETTKALGTDMIRIWAGADGSEAVDEETRRRMVAEAKEIADFASKSAMQIGIEYHQNTLTDTPESALALIEAIAKDNVSLYWQPSETLSVDERLASLDILASWISNVHVFNWKNYMERYSLADAQSDWQKYIDKIEKKHSQSRHYLLEFVKDDDPKNIVHDTNALYQLIKNI
ncbi:MULTISPECIES: sugar phosphate isomerase/epimerase family protein [unclassified Jeotgalibaca]|uniref:sugar phosphate isomerase/epimerase family protein n=1 Tax=unclassified Jeotgalibaca TaxID=2621505 RepID=UPI003FD01AC0